MCYTGDQIKRYLERLYNYTKQPVEEENTRRARCWNCHNSECFLFIWVVKFVIIVVQKMDMFWDTMMLKITIDYIFERRVFIRESISMKKRLIKFPEDYI